MVATEVVSEIHHRLEKHKLADAILATVNELLSSQGLMLKQGSAVDAKLIAAPSLTKNKKGNQWHFGMKAHRLVHHATILEMNVESYRRRAGGACPACAKGSLNNINKIHHFPLPPAPIDVAEQI